MFEKALTGNRKYWGWIVLLLAIIGVGVVSYLQQWFHGLGVTGMGRDVSWGLYIANFTFLVGVAASAVTVVLPYYLHNHKEFRRITTLGEFLAVAAILMCVLFIVTDLGQPRRVFNLFLHPSPTSPLFWDTIVLSTYLLLNLVIGWYVLDARHKEEAPMGWIKPLILISIPWAISIHTVTAFIYSGLVARPFWLTALMAPRFLSSAFASGPALLIILSLIVRRFGGFDVGKEALQKLAVIVTYATIGTVFFLLVEVFTVFYSGIPEHTVHFQYFFIGVEGKTNLAPWMWTAFIFWGISIVLLLFPSTRKREGTLAIAAVLVFVSMWIDKGLGLLMPGFFPSPTGELFEYWPTLTEALITLGIWALGFLVLTVFYKITVSVMKEVDEESAPTNSSSQVAGE
ncbi:MAG: sulfate reduction electron transfer complex DsrMKJOP subunit DsrP [Chloroflexota bacterium]